MYQKKNQIKIQICPEFLRIAAHVYVAGPRYITLKPIIISITCRSRNTLLYADMYLVIWIPYTVTHIFQTFNIHRQTSNVSRRLVGNTLVDHSDVVGATTTSCSTKHLVSIDCTKTTARRDEKYLSYVIWCDLYQNFNGICQVHNVNCHYAIKWRRQIHAIKYQKDMLEFTRICVGPLLP